MFDQIRAVIFDLDGTLLDSVGMFLGAIREVWRRAGLPAPDEQVIVDIMASGRPFWDSWDRLVPVDIENRERLQALCRQINGQVWQEIFAVGVTVIPGAVEAVTTIRAAGFLTGLVTSAWEKEKFGPFTAQEGNDRNLIDVVITRLDVPVMKPAPDPILTCAHRLGVAPAECIYVGDSPIDIIAGKAAGTMTVAVLTGAGSREALLREGPDLLLSDISHLVQALNISRVSP